MNTYYIELDFVRAEIKETGIAISQGDYGRVKFSIAVKKDGEIITDAASADISFQLTNGYIVQGVLSGAAGLYDYIFQGNELQAPGKTIATVTLNYADGRTSSETFSFDVRYNPLYGRFIDAGPYITDLENIKSQAQTYVEYLEKLIEQIKLEMGQTALTKESLANNFDITEEGVKALDAAAGRALNLNKIDKTAIVQTESTDTTTVPSSAYFKQVTDRVISDLDDHFLMSPDGVTGIQSISGNTWRRLQLQIINDDIAVFKSTDGGATWPDVKTLLTNADFRTSGVKLAEIFYDPLASSAVIKWTLSDNLIYQMVITNQGLRYDRWNGAAWENMWAK